MSASAGKGFHNLGHTVLWGTLSVASVSSLPFLEGVAVPDRVGQVIAITIFVGLTFVSFAKRWFVRKVLNPRGSKSETCC